MAKNKIYDPELSAKCLKGLRNRFLYHPRDLLYQIKVKAKNRKLITPHLWEEQELILDHLLKDESLLILKPRQIGSTTINQFYFFFTWLLSENPEANIISAPTIKKSSAKLQDILDWYHQLPDLIKELRPLSVSRYDHIELKDTGAQIIANGFLSHGGLRSSTGNRLLLTEFNWSDHPDELLSASLAAINDGQIIIETTANYYGDAMMKEIQKNQDGETNYQFLFFPWSQHQEYQSKPKIQEKDLTPEEINLLKQGINPLTGSPSDQYPSLTLNQIQWRRNKIGMYGSKERFVREYPLSIPEAYQQTVNHFLSDQFLSQLKVHPSKFDRLNYYEKPNQQDLYVIGIDPAMGFNQDYSAITVFNSRTLEMAASFYSKNVDPIKLMDYAQHLSTEYKDFNSNRKALINLETNNKCGGICLTTAQQLGLPIYQVNNKYWDTTSKNKPLLLSLIRKYIEGYKLKSVDQFLYNELRAAQFNDQGLLLIPSTQDSHFDAGMSLGLALYLIENAIPKPKNLLDKWGL